METLLKWFLRLNKVEIGSNREWGMAEVKMVSCVCTVMASDPKPSGSAWSVMEEARSVFKDRRVVEVDGVKDRHKFTFGDTGLVVAVREEIPLMVSWNLMLIEKDADVRLVGEQIDAICKSAIPAAVGRALSLGGNPVYPIIFSVVREAFGLVGQALRKNEDDMICSYTQDMVGWMDFPHGDRKAEGVPTMEGNGRVDYTMFGFK
jgi:hypothetical protein